MADGSKVFKKTSPDGKLSMYLGKRDFVDHVEFVEPVDGVMLIDPEYQKDKKVFVVLTCAFRYGRDDMELIGLSFRKDIFVQSCQVYPPLPEDKKPLSPLQEKLRAKLGVNAFPFSFNIIKNLPCSVTLQPGPEDTGKPCGVDFEVKGFCAENAEEKVHKKNTARLIIRKVQYAPEVTGPAPRAEITRQFMMSDKPLQLEASLNKEASKRPVRKERSDLIGCYGQLHRSSSTQVLINLPHGVIYYHGEPITINVKINNSTNKIVKKIKITVEQMTDVVLYSLDKYSKIVCCEEMNDTVPANSAFARTYSVTPLLSNNQEKRGLALDGKLKHGDTNLASSTIMRPGMDKEVMGILVSYKVKINLMASRGGILGELTSSDVGVELPLILMHPKPSEVTTSAEDVVIEEFARQKLQGEQDDEEEKEEA